MTNPQEDRSAVRTTEEALTECRAAWAAQPDMSWGWCVHHNIELEPLFEPAENRIDCILRNKSQAEHVCRLDNFRPVVSQLPHAILAASFTILTERAARWVFLMNWQTREKTYWEMDAADGTDKGLHEAYLVAKQAHERAGDAYFAASADRKKMEKLYDDILYEHRNEVEALHRRDVPHHTWNGASIF